MNTFRRKLRAAYRRLVLKQPLHVARTASPEEIRALCGRAGEYSLNCGQRSDKIIVSLTSFGPRLENLHLVIRSMLVQTVKPDALILYLDDMPAGSIPSSLREMEKYGLRIEVKPENIKPHKKYYYAMQEYPDDIVVTVDDDVIYPPNLIETLYGMHKRFPDCVAAARGHRILFEKSGAAEPYNDWDWEFWDAGKPSMQILATGVGGVLYPPHCMDEELFSLDLLQQLSLRADDLWLKVMQMLAGTKVVLCDQSIQRSRLTVPGSQTVTLKASNVHENANDLYFRQLMNHFHLSKKDFMD